MRAAHEAPIVNLPLFIIDIAICNETPQRQWRTVAGWHNS